MTLPQSWRMRVLALAISAILIVQTGVILSPLIGVETGGWYWPFLDYPMYSKTHFEGEAVKVRDQIAVILSDGTELDVELDDLDPNSRAVIMRMQPKAREALLQGLQDEGPEGYRQFVREYFRRLTKVQATAKK